MKPNFSRESLHIEKISFANNPDAFRAALDEIIKFNAYVNEFNYVQEFYSRMCTKLMQQQRLDCVNLFMKYDNDADDLMSRENFHRLMIDSGMQYVTLAESNFVFNIVSKFKPVINIKTFVSWVNSMKNLG